MELGFGTGLGLDNLFINRGTTLCSVSSPRMTSNDLEACTWEHLHGDHLEVGPPPFKTFGKNAMLLAASLPFHYLPITRKGRIERRNHYSNFYKI